MNLVPQNLNGCSVTRTGLVISEELSFESWATLGDQVIPSFEGLMWALGDWINYGNAKYGEKYAEALARFGETLNNRGYSKETLYKAASVASRVEFCRRLQNLSWSHHQCVAPLSPEDQTKWLKLATAEKMSEKALRRAIADSGKDAGATEENTTVPAFSPLAWINEGLRDFKNACAEEPISKWDDDRILIAWNGLLEIANEIGGPLKGEIQKRGLKA